MNQHPVTVGSLVKATGLVADEVLFDGRPYRIAFADAGDLGRVLDIEHTEDGDLLTVAFVNAPQVTTVLPEDVAVFMTVVAET